MAIACGKRNTPSARWPIVDTLAYGQLAAPGHGAASAGAAPALTAPSAAATPPATSARELRNDDRETDTAARRWPRTGEAVRLDSDLAGRTARLAEVGEHRQAGRARRRHGWGGSGGWGVARAGPAAAAGVAG